MIVETTKTVPKLRMSGLFAAAFSFFALLLLSGTQVSIAQEDPVIRTQQKLYHAIKNERQMIEVDCSGYRTSVVGNRYSEAIPYVECSMEHFRIMVIGWSTSNHEIIKHASSKLQELHVAQIPDGGISDEVKARLINGAGFIDKAMRKWFNSVGNLNGKLLEHGLFSGPIAQSNHKMLSENLIRFAKHASEYVTAIKSKPDMTAEEARSMTRQLHEIMYEPAFDALNQFRQSLLSEKDRTIRRYSRTLRRESLTYEEIMKVYIAMLDEITTAIQKQALTAWVDLEAGDDQNPR